MTAPCGTPAAYTMHIKRGEEADQSCRWARALYQEVHRWERGEALRVHENRTSARRQRALTILGSRHREELEQIVRDLINQDRAAGVIR